MALQRRQKRCYRQWVVLSISIARLLLVSGHLPSSISPCGFGIAYSHHCRRRHVIPGARASVSGMSSEAATSEVVPQRRSRQKRRKSINRRPPNYWADLDNVRREFRQFWTDLAVDIPDDDPPPIPNEGLLNHFARNDLRYVVVTYGGRESLAYQLGGAPIVPGKWATAVQESPELQQLLLTTSHGLSPDVPPMTPLQKKQLNMENPMTVPTKTLQGPRWVHRQGRRPRGYWNKQRVIHELYEYLDERQLLQNRPSVWMPRPSEIASAGREDLQLAIRRFGGTKKICSIAGLVPYRDWQYFDGQYELLVELRNYLEEHHEGNRITFPCASDIQRHGRSQLYALIQLYGGRKFLANRLGMTYSSSKSRNTSDEYADMNWGPFSIDFAIQLLQFIRTDQMRKKAPLRNPVISMPRRDKLEAKGAIHLHDPIMEFGGYENVARRLGLAFF